MNRLRGTGVSAGVCLAVALMLLSAAPARAQGIADRRRDQFPTEPGYLVVPFPYSLPGLGQGIGLLGFATNIFRTHADVYAFALTGDLPGYGVGVEEIHLLPNRLLLDVWHEQYQKGQIIQYPKRGMDTEKNDYQLVDAQDATFQGGDLVLVFGERRLEVTASAETGRYEIVAFRDRKGHLLQKLDKPFEQEERSYGLSAFLDGTDDRWDPRQGLRGYIAGTNSPPQSGADPDYYVVNAVFDVYIPIGKQSTWAFDFFHSQAVVQNKGETDPAALAAQVCPTGDPSCVNSDSTREYVANALAANENGSSESLGGRDRLRAYPDGRFQGAYTEYVGTELRFNLTDEITPFDYFIWKDVRTAIQLALIAEIGTVAESQGDLWNRSRADFGAGFRMVTASGAVYRADYVTGDEGPQVTVIVNYPW